jgi:hypothetical protein
VKEYYPVGGDTSEQHAAPIFKVELYTLKKEAGHSSKMMKLIYI